MKNKKTLKLLLSGIVLLATIFLNITHCDKTKTSSTLILNGLISVSTCQAESANDCDEDPDQVLYSPINPEDEITNEEDSVYLLRMQRLSDAKK